MADFRKEKYQYYFENGIDVKFKLQKSSEDLSIKPILVKDIYTYNIVSELLRYDKTKSDNIDIIRMSYLEYLVSIILSSEKHASMFIELSKLCFGTSDITFDMHDEQICIFIFGSDKKIKHIINSKEFDEIKNIILYQNDYNYKDIKLSDDVIEQYEVYNKITSKDVHTPTTEEKKAFIMLKTGYTLEQINNLPMRFFDLIYNCGIDEDEYIANKIIQGSYKYDVKDDVIHPQYKKKENPLDRLFVDKGEFESKLAKNGII